jgi:hypothetical protein
MAAPLADILAAGSVVVRFKERDPRVQDGCHQSVSFNFLASLLSFSKKSWPLKM